MHTYTHTYKIMDVLIQKYLKSLRFFLQTLSRLCGLKISSFHVDPDTRDLQQMSFYSSKTSTKEYTHVLKYSFHPSLHG
uniref:Uncharacterized protein n=1 Tax=Octopus bimaculoides TaxID=37653 RepID=A0A0L8GXE8_OCTBM